MARKSIFLLAAAVVLLYFSTILFMLSSFHVTRNMFYGGAYVNHMFVRQVPSVTWCKEQQFRSPPSGRVVALVSFPGSGNTWLRYLLQQATGILTGSIYLDHGLRMHGFPAESVTDGSVLVVKTHQSPPEELNQYHAAILLIRNPRDAILADFNRLHKGHIGTAPKSAFEKKTPDLKKSIDAWPTHVALQVTSWQNLHEQWLGRFPGPVHIVFYEALVNNTQPILQGILNFLYFNVTEVDMRCTMRHKEGIYRRRKKLQDFDPFTPQMYISIADARSKVLKLVADYRLRQKKRSTEARVFEKLKRDH